MSISSYYKQYVTSFAFKTITNKTETLHKISLEAVKCNQLRSLLDESMNLIYVQNFNCPSFLNFFSRYKMLTRMQLILLWLGRDKAK